MKKNALLLGTALGTLITCGSLAFAQEQAVTPIPGISASAGGTAQAIAQAKTVKVPLKSTYSESVITPTMIENTAPGTTAQEVLSREPSIYVTNNGPNGVNEQITFRAFADGEFSETYDNVPINDPFTAGVVAQADNDNNTLITKNDFDGVELYRGINNPANNSYNSLGGTINFIPRTPTDTTGGEVGASYGSFNSFDWHATLNTGLYDNVKQLFSFERNTSKGWTDYDNNDISNLYYSLDAPLNNGATNVYGSFIYNQAEGLVNQLTPVDLLHQFGDKYQFPSSAYRKQNNAMDFLAVGGVTQQITPDLSLDLKGFVSENDYTRNSFSTGQYEIYSLPDGSHRPYHLYAYYTNTFGVQPSATYVLPFNTIQVGGNLTFSHEHSREYFSATSPVIEMPNPDGSGNDFWNEHMLRTEGSVYVQDTISLLNDTIKIIPGGKYIWAETKNHDEPSYYYPIYGDVSNYAHYFSPTVSASYEFLPDTDAYFAYGQNIKFADISAYYNNDSEYDSAGNPVNVPAHPQPEHVNDYELGLRYEAGALTAAADVYREDFTNTFITSTNLSTQLSTTVNGGAQRYEGVEFQLGDDVPSPIADVPGDFAGYVNFAYNHAIYTSAVRDASVGSVYSGQPVGNVPQYLVSPGVSWTDENFYAGVDMHYVGKQYLNNAFNNIATSSTNGGYFLTNLNLKYTMPVNFSAVNALVFQFNVNNVFDVHYYTQADINVDNNGNPYKEGIVGAPRAFYGSVTAKF